MEHLLVASLLGALVLYSYDLFVTGPPAARPLIAHLPALAWYMFVGPYDDWRLLESYAAVIPALILVAALQLLMVQRDVALTSVFRRR